MPKDAIDPLLAEVGTRIRKLREARDLTQTALAKKAAIDRPYLVAIEAGKRNMTLLHLSKIARALRVSPGSLLPD